MPRVTARHLRKKFSEQVCSKNPLDREWTDATKEVGIFSKSILHEICGGKVSKSMTLCAFKKFRKAYESLFFRFVNGLIKRDLGVKSGLFAAMGAGAQTLGAGHIYWMKDITGDEAGQAFQDKFDALAQWEQDSAIWLQTTTRSILLYYLKEVVSEEIMSALLELLRSKTEAGVVLEWDDACKLMIADLVDQDALYLVQMLLTVYRDEGDSLLQ